MIFEWFDAVEDFIWLPLCPNKVITFPLVKVSHGPPESTFEGRPHYPRIISSANIVLIWLESSCRELYLLDSIWLKNLYKELSVIFFLQLEIPFLIFWIGEIFCKFLNFFWKVFETTEISCALWLCLLGRTSSFDWFAIWAILNDCTRSSSVCRCSLSLLSIVILLEIFLCHLTLDYHQACIDERLFEKLALEHSD